MNEHSHPARSASGPADAPPGVVRLYGELDLDTGRAAELDAAPSGRSPTPTAPRCGSRGRGGGRCRQGRRVPSTSRPMLCDGLLKDFGGTGQVWVGAAGITRCR